MNYYKTFRPIKRSLYLKIFLGNRVVFRFKGDNTIAI